MIGLAFVIASAAIWAVVMLLWSRRAMRRAEASGTTHRCSQDCRGEDHSAIPGATLK